MFHGWMEIEINFYVTVEIIFLWLLTIFIAKLLLLQMLLTIEMSVVSPYNSPTCSTIKTNIHVLFFSEAIISLFTLAQWLLLIFSWIISVFILLSTSFVASCEVVRTFTFIIMQVSITLSVWPQRESAWNNCCLNSYTYLLANSSCLHIYAVKSSSFKVKTKWAHAPLISKYFLAWKKSKFWKMFTILLLVSIFFMVIFFTSHSTAFETMHKVINHLRNLLNDA